MRVISPRSLVAITVAFVGLLHQECAIANPTKEETIKFLAEKINVTAVQFDSDTLTVDLSAIDSPCRLALTETHRTSAGQIQFADIAILDLKDINPTTITFAPVRSFGVFAELRYGLQSTNWLVQFFTTGKTQNISSKRIHYDKQSGGITKEDIRMVDRTQVLVKDQDTAQRVSKALDHLVRLCGGKNELF